MGRNILSWVDRIPTLIVIDSSWSERGLRGIAQEAAQTKLLCRSWFIFNKWRKWNGYYSLKPLRRVIRFKCTSKSSLLECSQAFKKQTQDTKKICISIFVSTSSSLSIFVSTRSPCLLFMQTLEINQRFMSVFSLNWVSVCHNNSGVRKICDAWNCESVNHLILLLCVITRFTGLGHIVFQVLYFHCVV